MRRLLIICWVSLLALPGAALAAHDQTVSFEAPRDLLDPARRESALNQIQGMGVTALRVILYWRDVAPQPGASRPPAFTENDPAAYNFSGYDPLIDAARSRGMRILLTVSGPVPRWATLSRRDQFTRPSPDRFAAFMEAVARHYAGRISLWSIWNEPNHPDFLRPQFFRGKPASGIWYRKLFTAGYRGLVKAGIADPKVLMGETAPVGTSHVVAPIVFLNTALCIDTHSIKTHKICKKLPAYGYAHHAYTRAQGPFYSPRGPNDVSIGSLSRLTRALDRASHMHKIKSHMPVFLTEFGIQSVPDPLYGVSEQRQNEYRAISERIAWQNPRVKWFSQYLLRDDNHLTKGPKISRYPGFESGLRYANGKAKLSLKSFALPLVAFHVGNSVSLWGLARPAHRSVTVTILVRGRTYKRIRTDSRGYFRKTVRYVAGRSYKLRWNGRTSAAVRIYPRL
ncbi:MAG: hypothetical protein QOG68_1377 [Solirubrobacteraceae bacterium]|nr:hypothetical protein [Solirubrobacteraceae bacterium]